MKQALNFANKLSSICILFDGHISVCIRSVRKTLSGITKAVLLNKLGPSLIYFKKRIQGRRNFKVLDKVNIVEMTVWNHSSYAYVRGRPHIFLENNVTTRVDGFWNNHALFAFFESDIFFEKTDFSGIWYLRKMWWKPVNLSTKKCQNIGETSEILSNLRIKISGENPK